MAPRPTALDTLLATDSFDGFVTATRAGTWPAALSLPEARRLSDHLAAINTPDEALRVAFVRNVTTEMLEPWLELAAAMEGFDASVYHAPFGLGPMEAAPGSGLAQHDPDVTVMLVTREDLHPDLAQPNYPTSGPEGDALRREVVERVHGLLERFRGTVGGQLLLAVVPPTAPAPAGLYDVQDPASATNWWATTQAALAGMARERLASTLLLDLEQVMHEVGRANFFDLRYWYASRYPFSAAAGREVARRIVAVGTVARTPRAKVIVLDADNTMWGGVVGEDGFDGIALSPDHPGNAFVDFQRRILDFQRRGFILAICSKNNPEDLDEVLHKHPHQVLRDDHFAAKRVNWLPKTDNLRSLAEELNLGLDSFVFVDDSDYECALVRRELPMVTVIQTPKKPADVPGCLDRLARLEVLSLTAEDRAKTKMYAEERKRRDLKSSVETGGGDISAYLASLDMHMTVRVNDSAGLKRLAQLTNKTNQFNLTTRRYDEQQMRAMLDDDRTLVTSFSLADTFGDSGIVGLAIVRQDEPAEASLDTFLMSCRVIGRKAESAFLAATMNLAAERGAKTFRAQYLPTRKNRLVEKFLPEHGFEGTDEAGYERDLESHPAPAADAFPIRITLA